MKNNRTLRASKHAFLFFNKNDSNTKYAAFIFLAFILFTVFIYSYNEVSPFSGNPYDSYLLQTLNWFRGSLAFEQNIPHLELAVYNGEYFLSFPPVPSVFLVPFALIWGIKTNTALICCVYASLTFLVVYLTLSSILKKSTSLYLSFLIIFSGAYSTIYYTGAVWHHAQILAFFLISLSIYAMQKMKPTLSLVFWALAVGCRPFSILYIIPLLLLSKQSKQSLKSLFLGFLFAFIIGTLYMCYNYIRFKNIFEFGHNFLPEFSTEGNVQFSFRNLTKNTSKFLFGSPFFIANNTIIWEYFGFSIFIAVPAISVLFFFFIQDAVKKHLDTKRILIFFILLLNISLLLSHSTMGGYQFGARYLIDCTSYLIIYILIFFRKDQNKGFSNFILCFLLFLFVFSVYAGKNFVLP